MSDYGHPLEFGAFITPSAADPRAVVGLAHLVEEVGLDLVTFQDHPYNPSLLDTWTLLSWVAAGTSRIGLSANVLNLPLRHPALLARSSATLDLLSGGRFELGLGAGAFWPAIEGMSGYRLTAPESVRALREGIEVLRGLWDTTTDGPFTFDGEFYHVPRGKRGPSPAHDIAIWLGAYKPKMLELTGRAADGWIVTYEFLNGVALADAHRAIDDAAEAAGRQPGAVRRLLNLSGAGLDGESGMIHGSAQEWVEQLVPLVCESGFSTFILATEDPGRYATFGNEVAPALRDAVDRERRT
jgi:alkanesulfonate monooxygenase SsuD/methylene tetrahydromethanopterin reductase-like flavin-dependent oxidoreductase (luciferase family)